MAFVGDRDHDELGLFNRLLIGLALEGAPCQALPQGLDDGFGLLPIARPDDDPDSPTPQTHPPPPPPPLVGPALEGPPCQPLPQGLDDGFGLLPIARPDDDPDSRSGETQRQPAPQTAGPPYDGDVNIQIG